MVHDNATLAHYLTLGGAAAYGGLSKSAFFSEVNLGRIRPDGIASNAKSQRGPVLLFLPATVDRWKSDRLRLSQGVGMSAGSIALRRFWTAEEDRQLRRQPKPLSGRQLHALAVAMNRTPRAIQHRLAYLRHHRAASNVG